jgi:hypothetical protein
MATSLITGATGTGSVTANQKVLDMADGRPIIINRFCSCYFKNLSAM